MNPIDDGNGITVNRMNFSFSPSSPLSWRLTNKARSVSRCFLGCFLVLLLFWGHNPSKIVTRVEKKQHLTEKKQRCFRDWDLSNFRAPVVPESNRRTLPSGNDVFTSFSGGCILLFLTPIDISAYTPNDTDLYTRWAQHL